MPAESALVLMVPESEALVKSFRDKYDPSAAKGMPAHITLLFPFKSPPGIDGAVLAKLQSCFANFSSFDYSLSLIKRFPEVVYVAPENDEPLRKLTMAIWKSFPETPPYQGKYADVVPHLTVAFDMDEEKLNRIADEFMGAYKSRLPISAKATEVALMDNGTGRWQVRATFILGK